MSDRVSGLRARVEQAPNRSGVYLFKDRQGRVVYVGKARSLADRLRAYLAPGTDARLCALRRKARAVDWIVTDSEADALILEENLIKLNKPRYNVRLKDDKKFPYLKLTVKEQFPALVVTRNLRPDGSEFFGPYTDAKALRRAVRAARRVFRVRSCRRPIAPDRPERPCLNLHLRRCSGPCAGNESVADYAGRVQALRAFLTGRSNDVGKEIEKLMWQASERQDFETAATFRDQLRALCGIRPHLLFGASDRTARDAIGLALGTKTAHVTVLRMREGRLLGKDALEFAVQAETPETEVLATALRSFYVHTGDLPVEILVPKPVDEVEGFEQWLSRRAGRAVGIAVPERGARLRLLELAQRNADLESARRGALARIPAANAELGRILGMTKVPRRIEAIDISNTSGRQAVGAIVVFRDTRPMKSEYRRFRIKTVNGPDDFAMIAEVLERRARRLAREKRSPADLVLVDGGKGQLSAAHAAYCKLGQEVPMLGFAKRTDQVFYGDGREFQIPSGSPALRLLKSVRDEAHRFAISYHRRLRTSQMTNSILDHLPGIGPCRRLALLRHFGSVERLRGASQEELVQIPGIGPELARRLHEMLHA